MPYGRRCANAAAALGTLAALAALAFRRVGARVSTTAAVVVVRRFVRPLIGQPNECGRELLHFDSSRTPPVGLNRRGGGGGGGICDRVASVIGMLLHAGADMPLRRPRRKAIGFGHVIVIVDDVVDVADRALWRLFFGVPAKVSERPSAPNVLIAGALHKQR